MVEGAKECERGLNSFFEVHEVIVCPELIGERLYEKIRNLSGNTPLFTLTQKVYAKLAYRKDSEGIIILFKKKEHSLPNLRKEKDKSNYFIILENIEKPGNLGAILRSADGTGTRCIILTGKGTDHYNPNVIRASLGTFFSVPVIKSDNESIIKWAKENEVELYAAALPAYSSLYDISFKVGNNACIFGAEDIGLSDFWLQGNAHTYTIPMNGIADSLNLSVSVAVSSYEYLRQNKMAGKSI